MKKIILLILLVGILGFIIWGANSFTKILTRTNQAIPKINPLQINPEEIPKISTVAEQLRVPWALDFLPEGRIIFTERKGTIKIVEGETVIELIQIDAFQSSESGLHGIAVDPEFTNNNFIYVYYTYSGTNDNTQNRVSRFELRDNKLINERTIIDNIPGASRHDGGRIKFGPDGYLYITTGDAIEPSLSQNKNSIAGKILRINKDGSNPSDNPFRNAIYSYGHRNPQGITWNDTGKLFSTEHGNSATDEFNEIERGGNYGWPTITGDEVQNGMITPRVHSGSDTWAPGGIAFADGKFYFAGLRGNALYQVTNTNGTYTINEFFKDELGRIRDVVTGPDNMLYITTSNHDGRGIPSEVDDRIIRINPTKL